MKKNNLHMHKHNMNTYMKIPTILKEMLICNVIFTFLEKFFFNLNLSICIILGSRSRNKCPVASNEKND